MWVYQAPSFSAVRLTRGFWRPKPEGNKKLHNQVAQQRL